MLHHNRAYIDTLEAERRSAAARHRASAQAADLERTVQAAVQGDRGAWTELVEKFTARVRGVARAHRLGAHDVDDVMQTTWLRLLENIDKVQEPRALGAWLETTGRRESLRAIRARGRECPTDSSELVDQPVEPVDEQRLVAAERRAALAECGTALAKALEHLPPRQRELLPMLFGDTVHSYETISNSLDLPVGSIGPTRARALTRLSRDRTLVDAVEKLAE